METRGRSAPVEVFPTSDVLMEAAAERFVRCASEASGVSGRFAVALSGGSTPRRLYTLLATDPQAAHVDSSRVHVFWGDERCVPPGNPASNYRMARESFLAHVPVAEANVHRIRGEADPAEAAAAYERELRAAFVTPEGPPRSVPGSRFDLVLLGMGNDGHTASLFPGTAAVQETTRWVVAYHVAAMSNPPLGAPYGSIWRPLSSVRPRRLRRNSRCRRALRGSAPRSVPAATDATDA